MKTNRPNFATIAALTIALLSGTNCLYLSHQPHLTPEQTKLLHTSIVLFDTSSKVLIRQKREK
jgi:hypothetical protein